MHIKQRLAILALVALLGGCAANQEAMPEKAMSAEPDAAMSADAIAAATAAAKKANSVDGEWRDTGMMIKSAQAAADKGDYATAIKLAKKAQEQGELGYQQAVSQKDLKMPSYIQ